jgi:hypothetical protein
LNGNAVGLRFVRGQVAHSALKNSTLFAAPRYALLALTDDSGMSA